MKKHVLCMTKIAFLVSRLVQVVSFQCEGPSGAFVTHCNISCLFFLIMFKGGVAGTKTVC